MTAEIENNLTPGGLAFNHPDRMAFGETLTIQLKVESGARGVEIAPTNYEEGNVVPADIEVVALMPAILVGRGFDIGPLTPPIQALPGNAEWKWQITAEDSGKQELALTVNALIEVAVGGSRLENVVYPVKVFEETIDLQVGVFQGASGFLRDNFVWLGPLLLIPMAGIGWDRVRRRLKETEGGTGGTTDEEGDGA